MISLVGAGSRSGQAERGDGVPLCGRLDGSVTTLFERYRHVWGTVSDRGSGGSTRTNGERHGDRQSSTRDAGAALVLSCVFAIVLAGGLAGVAAADDDRGHGNDCDGHDEDNPATADDEAGSDPAVDDSSSNHDAEDCKDGDDDTQHGDDESGDDDSEDEETDDSEEGNDGSEGRDHDSQEGDDGSGAPDDDTDGGDDAARDTDAGTDGDDDSAEEGPSDGGGTRDPDDGDEGSGVAEDEAIKGTYGSHRSPSSKTDRVEHLAGSEERFGLNVFASGLVVVSLVVAITILGAVHSLLEL